MVWMIILLVLCVLACGYFLSSSSKTMRTVGGILALIGTIFCMYVGYSIGGIVGAIIGIIIMLFVIGTGINENNKLEANEYLASKNKERKEQNQK